MSYIKNMFLKLLLFNNEQISTINLAKQSKNKKKKVWYLNNLILPFGITYSPYIFYRLSQDFGKINFNKGFVELTIAGGITLLGINVMRISLSLINEKIDESKIPSEIRRGALDDIETIKSTLRGWITGLTIVGVIFYISQIMGFIGTTEIYTGYYVTTIMFVSLLSIYLGRLITIIQSNFFDDDSLIQIWILALNNSSKKSFDDLKKSANEGL